MIHKWTWWAFKTTVKQNYLNDRCYMIYKANISQQIVEILHHAASVET